MLILDEAQTKPRKFSQVSQLVLFSWYEILVQSAETVMSLRVWGTRDIQSPGTSLCDAQRRQKNTYA